MPRLAAGEVGRISAIGEKILWTSGGEGLAGGANTVGGATPLP